jgi:hypothetical protein
MIDVRSFGCVQGPPYPVPEDFSCSERIFESVLNQSLEYPTGSKWLYSDLSMITMQYVLGTVIARNAAALFPAPGPSAFLLPSCAHADPVKQPGLYRTCYYEAFHRAVVLQSLGMASTQYLLPESQWQDAMPTWKDTTYRYETLQGQVSDGNAYALGGIAGHAGIFSSARDMGRFIGMWGFSAFGAAPHALINSTTARLFTTNPDPTFGPRALGWLTQAPTDHFRGCGNLSDSTFYHTGYTGTLICADPTRNITLVLLTNRVYPNATGEGVGTHEAFQSFSNAALATLFPEEAL